MRPPRIDRIALVAAGLALVAASLPATAAEMTTSPSAVAACLCARALVVTREGELKVEQKAYEQSKREAETMSRQIAESKAKVNTENRDEINAYSRLLERDGAAQQAFREESARMAAVVNRYNEAVNDNNAMCVGRLFNVDEVEAVKATLACPR